VLLQLDLHGEEDRMGLWIGPRLTVAKRLALVPG
jgi:hypothetical protein